MAEGSRRSRRTRGAALRPVLEGIAVGDDLGLHPGVNAAARVTRTSVSPPDRRVTFTTNDRFSTSGNPSVVVRPSL